MQALGDALGTPLGNALRSSSVHAFAHALGMPLRNALRSTSAVHASGYALGKSYAVRVHQQRVGSRRMRSLLQSASGPKQPAKDTKPLPDKHPAKQPTALR